MVVLTIFLCLFSQMKYLLLTFLKLDIPTHQFHPRQQTTAFTWIIQQTKLLWKVRATYSSLLSSFLTVIISTNYLGFFNVRYPHSLSQRPEAQAKAKDLLSRADDSIKRGRVILVIIIIIIIQSLNPSFPWIQSLYRRVAEEGFKDCACTLCL